MHRYALDDTGIIYQNIDRTQLLGYRCNHGGYGRLVRHVAYISARLDPFCRVCRQSIVHVPLRAAVEGYCSPRARQSLRYGEAYAVGRARNQRNLAFQ